MEESKPIISKGKINLKVLKDNVIEFVKFAIIALIIVVPIRMFIAQPFIVSGSSMFPTFHDGEYLIIDELSYNLGEPHRQDVVVFRYPKNPKKYFIKRVIGLPNETIIIKDGKITIKNSEFPEAFNSKKIISMSHLVQQELILMAKMNIL
jgi:signal peptidase I